MSALGRTVFTAVLIGGIGSCGGKVQTGEPPQSTGPASAGSSVGGSPGVSTEGQFGGIAIMGSGVGGRGSSGTLSEQPAPSICMDRPAAEQWLAACATSSNLDGITVSSPHEPTAPEVLAYSCTCAGCAAGVAGFYDQCSGRWFLSFVACSADPQHCATLRLSFVGQYPDPHGEFGISDSGFVDTNGFTWQLASGVVRDDLGNFGGVDGYQAGRLLSFELNALAVDPDGRSKSWPLAAHVSACIVSAVGCAK